MPQRAAILMVSRLEQATQSGGCGFCTGFGTTLRHGISKNSPLKPGYGFITIMSVHCSTPSFHIRRFSTGSKPTLKPPSSIKRRALAGAEFDAAVGDEVERGDALGDPRRVIVFRRHQADAVAEPDSFGALRAGREEDFRRRGMRIFLEEMVLDLPGVVDAELVGEFDLIERLLEQPVLVALVPRPRQLVLVENAELHGRSLTRIPQRRYPLCEQNMRIPEFVS